MTIGICARNAATTVVRAVLSVLPEKDCEVLFVDDHCTDNTVELARKAGGGRIRFMSVPGEGGLAAARQVGLLAMNTPFGAWLDADDEWIPGRVERFSRTLENFDVAVDTLELYDGPSGKFLRRMESPVFLSRETVPSRLFERNYLPGDAQSGFRVETFRAAGGYDAAQKCAESFDIILRAVMRGARFHYAAQAGYKMYAYQGSLSRQLDKMRENTCILLRKHDYARVRELCLSSGESPRIAGWVLVAMALYRNEPDRALQFIEEASPPSADSNEILESDGPLPVREGWRRAFVRGTILLLLGGRDEEAAAELQRAESLEGTAEGANNLGVALARMGKTSEAGEFFEKSESRFPGYLDAKLNGQRTSPLRITTHPLRRQASRSEYLPAARR